MKQIATLDEVEHALSQLTASQRVGLGVSYSRPPSSKPSLGWAPTPAELEAAGCHLSGSGSNARWTAPARVDVEAAVKAAVARERGQAERESVGRTHRVKELEDQLAAVRADNDRLRRILAGRQR